MIDLMIEKQPGIRFCEDVGKIGTRQDSDECYDSCLILELC